MHLGSTISNRAESAHAKLKRQLRSSQLNFERSWVQASGVERVSRFCFYKGFECNCVRVRKRQMGWMLYHVVVLFVEPTNYHVHMKLRSIESMVYQYHLMSCIHIGGN
ncbi:unnamed protein product [Prunus armeniaca]